MESLSTDAQISSAVRGDIRGKGSASQGQRTCEVLSDHLLCGGDLVGVGELWSGIQLVQQQSREKADGIVCGGSPPLLSRRLQ